MKILFVSWDGPQVTYLQGLFLPMFAALRAHGIHFHVLQFTWASRESVQQTREAYRAAGIGYQAVRVWRWPIALGAVLTALWGARQIRRAIRHHSIDAVMPRSIMPALATLMARGTAGVPILLDADGLAIDERVEFDSLPISSLRYRLMRDIEVQAVRLANVVLTRTASASEVLHARAGAGTSVSKFHVVGNGRDANVYHPFDAGVRKRVRARLGIPAEAPVLVYAGSMGAQYCPREMLQLFAAVLRRRPDARLLVLTKWARPLLDLAAQMLVPAQAMSVMALQPEDVPEYLACADLGLALRTASFSMRAVAPIKLGEYLLCGLPVVASKVIGNTRVMGRGTGFLVDSMDQPAAGAVADWFVDTVLADRDGFRQRCAELGKASFSLEDSVHAYARAIGSLAVAPATLTTECVGASRTQALEGDASRRGAVLYVSYDGMLEPLGQSQVLAYLEHLAAERSIHLLSFEKPEGWVDGKARERVQARMHAAGIRWHPRRYHRHPSSLATSWDICVGTFSGLWLVVRHRIRIVHARSYVAGVMALVLERLTGAKFVFDMRGFWADERVDGGLWPRGGRLFRVAKWFERRFLLRANHVVSLTHAAVREMERFNYLQGGMPPITVIPTCADLSRFVPKARPDEGFVLGYVGSAGTWYLFDAVVACFVQLLHLRPDARLLIINRTEHAYIKERLAAGGVSMDAVELRSADHSEVPLQMARMHAGIFFIKPVFSKQASAPTKLGEFLGCGIPCLGNSGVGDMAGILESENVGVALDNFEEASLQKGLEVLLALTQDPDIQDRCVAAAQLHFSLDEGVARYKAVYRSMDRA